LGDSPGYDLLACFKGNIIEVLAGKVVALVTAHVFMFQGASPYLTRLAVAKLFVRHATPTNDLLGRDPINRGQYLFEFLVIITMGHQNGADSTIQTARGQ
jgi:hypothetical protein